MRVPDHALVQWAARTFGDEVATRVISPLVADWAKDLETAASPSAHRTAWLRGAVAFARCTVSVGLRAARPQRADLPPLTRGVAVACGSLALGVGVLVTPYLPWWLDRGAAFLPVLRHVVLIAVALALPFSLLPAALLLGSRAAGPATWRARAALTGAAVTTAAVWRSGRGGPCRRSVMTSGTRSDGRCRARRLPTTRRRSASPRSATRSMERPGLSSNGVAEPRRRTSGRRRCCSWVGVSVAAGGEHRWPCWRAGGSCRSPSPSPISRLRHLSPHSMRWDGCRRPSSQRPPSGAPSDLRPGHAPSRPE